MDNELKNQETATGSDELEIFKSSMEQVPVAISIIRENNAYLYHNIVFEKMFGYSIEDLQKQSIDDLFVDLEVYAGLHEALQSGESWNAQADMQTKTGVVLPVHVHIGAIRDQQGRIISYLATYTDITEQKRTERELKHRNEYLSAFHSISLGMFRRLNLTELLNALIVRACRLTKIPNGFLHLYDPDENILVMKAACGNLADNVGYKLEVGQGLGGRILESGEPIIVDNYQEWPYRLGDPNFDKIYSAVGIPLVSGSKIEGVIGLSHHEKEASIDPEIISVLEEFSAIAQIAIDNAKLFESQKMEIEKRIALEKERKDIEARLYQSQRMESIGTLAGGIAHDFNNILTSIMGFTQIAIGDIEEDSTLYSDLNEIYKASLRAKDLIQQILTFARQSDEKVNPLRVSLIAKEVLKFIRSSIPSTIRLQQNIISKATIVADPTQIYQVFLNLFTNASQSMEKDGGLLSVEIVDETLEQEKRPVKPGDYVKIIVSDTGAGISQNHINKIFEPYFTTKKIGEGTGLGLAVVHGTIKSLGGEIVVKSQEDVGTVFTIYLPVSKDGNAAAESVYKEQDCPGGNQEHILVVDDEAPIVQVEKRILEKLNYRVTAFTNSLEALDAFIAAPEKYDALLTDMTMPHMTGDILIENIWAKRPDMPAILCTGFSQFLSEDVLEAKNIQYYCRKPVLKVDLAKAVRNALDSPKK